MGSVSGRRLLDEFSPTGGVTETSKKFATDLHEIDYVAILNIANYAGAGNIAVTVEHSPDNGENWETIATFTPVAADVGLESKKVTEFVFSSVRAKTVTAAGVTAGDVTVDLLNNRYK